MRQIKKRNKTRTKVKKMNTGTLPDLLPMEAIDKLQSARAAHNGSVVVRVVFLEDITNPSPGELTQTPGLNMQDKVVEGRLTNYNRLLVGTSALNARMTDSFTISVSECSGQGVLGYQIKSLEYCPNGNNQLVKLYEATNNR
jgi:hypothetical protein